MPEIITTKPKTVNHQCRVMREVSYQALVIPTKLVPAEAGSGNPVFLATSGFWIPASAGMTVIFATSHR